MWIGDIIRTANNSKTIINDSFNRDDSNTLGVADTGQSWISYINNVGITSNKATGKVESDNAAYIQSNVSNVRIKAKIIFNNASDAISLNLRSDGSNLNRMRFVMQSFNLQIRKVIAAASTTLANVSITLTWGTEYTISCEASGNDYKAYVDGNLVASVTDDNVLKSGYSHCGLSFYDTIPIVSTVDDFIVEAL